jgi:CubicO group peptidase (beta-lactamase class C family)
MTAQPYSERLKDADEIVTTCMKRWHVPGSAVAVVTDKDVLLAEGYGFRDIRKKEPVTAKTIFPIASITKSFTAMGIALLVDEGKLSWDDPVTKHLPWFKMKDDYVTAHMTIRDLLCHRSGLPRHDLVWYGSQLSTEEGIRRLAFLEATKGFRSVWQYQNIMYGTAGFLAGQVAGSDWQTYTRERIFKVLGMKNSVCLFKDFLNKSNKSLGYQRLKEKTKLTPYIDRMNASPAGSIFSNINDIMIWLQLHLNSGKFDEKQFISEKQLNEMHSPQMIVGTGSLYREVYGTRIDTYGMGWHIQPSHGTTMIHHGGNINGFSTFASFLPQEKLGMIVLCNLEATAFRRVITQTLHDILLGLPRTDWDSRFEKANKKLEQDKKKEEQKSLKARKKNTKPSHPLKAFTGSYTHPGYPELVIRLRKGKLEAFVAGKFEKMEHYHYNIFEIIFNYYDTREKVSFNVGDKGEIVSLEFKIEVTLPPAKFERKKQLKVKSKK